ncbi:MAG: alpha/beta hydrolase [Meiothermus sp.]
MLTTMTRDVWLEVQGVRTYAKVMGAGPRIVLVPGMGCSHLYFKPLQTALSRDFEVWAYDPAGQGLSRAPQHQYRTTREVSDHLAHWLRAAGLQGSVLFGHSQGGEVLVDFQARHPGLASRLVLCAPTGLPEYPNIPAQILYLFVDSLRERPVLSLRVIRSYFMAGPGRVWALLHDQLHHDTLPQLPQIRVPVLIVAGTRDPIVRPKMMSTFREAIPHARLLEIKGGTHAVHDSHTAEVAQTVREFVTEGKAEI